MLEPSATLTFVYDDIKPNLIGCNASISRDRLPLLEYLDTEDIPYDEKSVSLYDDEIDDIVYYPIVVDWFDPDFDYVGCLSEEALTLCRDRRLHIIFYYTGSDDPIKEIRPNLMTQIIEHDITLLEVKVIIANKTAERMPPCVYFPMDELQFKYDYQHKHITEINEGKRDKKFTCIATHDTPARKLFASSIDYHGLHDYGHFEYHDIPRDITPQGIDAEIKAMHKWHTHWAGADKLMSMFSLRTPILAGNVSDYELYQNSYWNFVMEENFDKRRISLTHNTFRPILNMQPFIIVGSPGSLALLKDLGYQTFGDYVNEEYDNVKNNEERMLLVFRLAYQLAILRHEDHITMMENLAPILKHNQEHFLASKKHRCFDVMRKIR